MAIEVKWSASAFDPVGMKAFRALHPGSINILVANDIQQSYTREVAGMIVRFCPLSELVEIIDLSLGLGTLEIG